MQLTAHLLGGKVAKGVKGEYGKAELEIVKACSLFDGVKERSIAWMSHFDEVETAPQGFDIVAKSGVIAGMANEDKKSLLFSSTLKFLTQRREARCWRTLF